MTIEGMATTVARASGAAWTRTGTSRWFFAVMAVIFAATVFSGFAPSFYLRGRIVELPSASPLSPLVIVHGVLSTLWIITFIVQTTLVASRRTRVHVWLGPFAIALAVVVAVISGWTTLDALRRGVGVRLGFDPRVWWLGSTFPPVLLFSGFVAAGYRARRRPETHKRLMLLATLCLSLPALGRIGLFYLGGQMSWITAAVVAALGAAVVHDLHADGRVSRVLLWGGLIVLAFPRVMMAFASTPAGLAIADRFR